MEQTRLRKTGLSWLAARNPERWIQPSGDINISRIAEDADISRFQIHRVLAGTSSAGVKFQRHLRRLAESTGASRDHANEELFEDVDTDGQAAA